MLEVAQKYLQLKSGEYYKCFGKVDKVVGLTIESIGPKAKLNDLCMIFLDKERRDYVMSEVVGFKDSHIILMPFDNVEGVGVGCIVENTGHPLTVAVGDELLGHTVDGILDISGGGIRFSLSTPLEEGTYFMAQFSLALEECTQQFNIVCKVINCTQSLDYADRYFARSKFIFDRMTEREKIVRFVFEEERRIRRREME